LQILQYDCAARRSDVVPTMRGIERRAVRLT